MFKEEKHVIFNMKNVTKWNKRVFEAKKQKTKQKNQKNIWGEFN